MKWLSGQPSTDQAREVMARADSLRRLGEREAAASLLEPLLEHPDPAVAVEVSYRLALLRLELEYPREASGMLEKLLARFPESPLADRATFLLGVARRRAGDCPGAIEALSRYSQRTRLLGSHAALQLAICYQQIGNVPAALERTEDALQAGSPRLLRIEALERQADILEKNGNRQEALERYEQLLQLARDRNYTAGLHLSAARLNGELGREAQDIRHLVAVVDELWSTRDARTALNRLVELGADDHVSYYSAGLVRFFAGDYAAAQRNFDGALASSGEAGNHAGATYYRAVSRVRLGAEIDGAQELLALPGSFPTSSFAPVGLLRGGKVLESNGRYSEAATAYRRVANDYPASADSKEGRFRLGFVNLLRGAPGEAGAAWAQLASSDAQQDLRTLGLLWAGKLASQSGDQAAARAHWQQAVDLSPNWYGGFRSRNLLAGNAQAQLSPVVLDIARAMPGADEIAELDSWASARGARLADVLAEPAVADALVRADELLALGFENEAGWEIDELTVRFANDPARLAALAIAQHQRGLTAAALRQAQQTLDAARIVSRQAPVALQKALYPLPYADYFQAQGERHGVDPLLLAALVRQESLFQASARSSANAMGLAQVVPATGEGIAAALGRADFKTDDLLRPGVSLEFGAFYLGQRLRRFNGLAFPSLAAYNAGDSAVDRWIRDFGTDDVDVFAERIPYGETNHYVKVVYENYGLYQALYGAR